MVSKCGSGARHQRCKHKHTKRDKRENTTARGDTEVTIVRFGEVDKSVQTVMVRSYPEDGSDKEVKTDCF